MLLTQMVIIAMITETGIIKKKRKWRQPFYRNSDYQWPKVFRDNGQQIDKGAYGDSYGDLYAFYDIN